jgi:hypothetical protein
LVRERFLAQRVANAIARLSDGSVSRFVFDFIINAVQAVHGTGPILIIHEIVQDLDAIGTALPGVLREHVRRDAALMHLGAVDARLGFYVAPPHARRIYVVFLAGNGRNENAKEKKK